MSSENQNDNEGTNVNLSGGESPHRVYKYIENPEALNVNHDNVDTQSIPVVNEYLVDAPGNANDNSYVQYENSFVSHNFDNGLNNNSSQFDNGYDNFYTNSNDNNNRNKSKGFPIVVGLAIAAVIGGASGYFGSELSQDVGNGSFTSSTGSVSKSSGVVDSPSAWGDTINSVSDSVASLTIYKDDGTGGYGSGVIISKDGYILTNHHVVDGSQRISVSLNDGSIYDAKVVGSDSTTDLAVIALKNSPKNLKFASFADSEDVKSGDNILAIGNPLGLDQTSTTGIVSAVNRPVTSNQNNDNSGSSVYTNAIQIDAAVNPGNSGGPLFNSNGDVIGITSSIAIVPGGLNASSAGSIGLGFAIPSNQASKVADALINDGVAHHGLLGARIQTGEAKVDKHKKSGAKIVEVTDDGPAKKAGLKNNDVIVSIDGKVVDNSESLTAFVREYSPNEKIKIEYARNGKVHKANVKLGELVDEPSPDKMNPAPLPDNPNPDVKPNKDN